MGSSSRWSVPIFPLPSLVYVLSSPRAWSPFPAFPPCPPYSEQLHLQHQMDTALLQFPPTALFTSFSLDSNLSMTSFPVMHLLRFAIGCSSSSILTSEMAKEYNHNSTLEILHKITMKMTCFLVSSDAVEVFLSFLKYISIKR